LLELYGKHPSRFGLLFNCTYSKTCTNGIERTMLSCINDNELRGMHRWSLEIDEKTVAELIPLALYEREGVINLSELKMLVLK
jgi:hypothetical protein